MADSSDAVCPECGTQLDGARVCPSCDLRIRTADEELTEDAISAVVDGALADAGGVQPPASHAVPYSLRLAVALAIAIPFAPLSVFALTSIVPTHPIIVILVSLLSWMVTAAGLARGTVPSLVVGRGLLVLGVVVAASPLVVLAGRALAGESATADPLIDSTGALIGSFLLFGVIVLGLGAVVTRAATRKRDAWEADAAGESSDRR